ncbi:MAG: phage Gp37/Gp68 family protein [Anaerolineaceae bacterium]
MGKTKIEWADRVWNPVVGCTPVSAGCAHCYAKRIYDRFYQDKPFSKVQLHRERLFQPLHWKNPGRVFVNSMSDLFHPDVPFSYIDDVFGVMTGCPKHTFMVLTKRPERMLEWSKQYYLPGASGSENVWLGVTAENQKAADERIPLLLETPAAVRFVSAEPMLGPVDLSKYLFADPSRPNWARLNMLQWVICGGESGPGARPMHPDWAKSIRDQCQAAGAPFFFKQHGEFTYKGRYGVERGNSVEIGDAFQRVGKKKAGRLLDGVEWNQYPEVK